MKRVLNLLYRMKQMPGAFFGNKNLGRLSMSIAGYVEGINECERKYHWDFQRQFQEFIDDKYPHNGAYGWADIIAQNSASDEEAFDNFYELLDEFLIENGQIPFSDSRAKDVYVFPYWKNNDNR